MTLVLQDTLVLSPATAEHLQEEIDTLEAASDVTDVVADYDELLAYDTSKLTDNDIIKVLIDETHEDGQSYYRWVASEGAFEYIGSIATPPVTSVNSKIGDVILDAADVKAIPQLTTLPAAGVSNVNKIVQYTGATNQNYTNGYFYKCVSGAYGVTFTPREGVSTVISITPENFYAFLEDKCEGRNFTADDVTHGMIGYYNAERYSFSIDTDDPDKWASLSFTITELEEAGFTFVPYLDAQQGVDYTCGVNSYAWENVSVQESLPDQANNAGKFLTTDGTTPSWSDKPMINEITNGMGLGITSKSGSNIVITNAASITPPYNFYTKNVIINPNGNRPGSSNSVAVGYNSTSGDDGVAIGSGAMMMNTAKGVAIGSGATTGTGISIGYRASSTYPSYYGIAIGYQAGINGVNYAIQLGSTGAYTYNSDANTFKVANHNGNFEMMSADGTVPEARLADTTSAAQGQALVLDNNLNATWGSPTVATFRVWGANE